MAGERGYVASFLYKALDDAQSTIRSLDTKAGVGVVVLGAMLGRVLEHDQLAAIRSAGPYSAAIAAIFALLAVSAAVLAFRTVFPMINPAANVSLPDGLRPAFFVTKLQPCGFCRLFSSDPRFARLSETHESYSAQLVNATEDSIEKTLAAEVLKVSFIRQMKTDRLVAFAKVLIATVIVFTALLLIIPRKESPSQSPSNPCTAGSISIGPSSTTPSH